MKNAITRLKLRACMTITLAALCSLILLLAPDWRDALAQSYPTTNQTKTFLDIQSVCSNLSSSAPTSTPEGALRRDCSDLLSGLSGGDSQAVTGLVQITIDQARQPLDASQTSVGTQTENLGTRLAALRGGAVGISLRQLAFSIDGRTISGEALTELVNHALGTGGGASAGSLGDFERLGIFLNGTITTGDKDTTEDEAGFDFDTWGITAGVDYRFTDNFILGGALGYSDSDNDLDGKVGDEGASGSLDSDGWSLALFGTYYHLNQFYLDGMLSYGGNDFDQKRDIRYALSGRDPVNQTLSTDFDGNVFSASLGGGYSFKYPFLRGSLDFGPVGRLQYLYADVDGYQEKASSPSAPGSGWIMDIEDQDYESFNLSLGAKASYAWSQSWGVLLPQARFEWVHEFSPDNDNVDGKFVGDTTNTPFSLDVNDDDENYFNLNVGIAADFAHGASAFFNYQRLIGYERLSFNGFNAGLRWAF